MSDLKIEVPCGGGPRAERLTGKSACISLNTEGNAVEMEVGVLRTTAFICKSGDTRNFYTDPATALVHARRTNVLFVIFMYFDSVHVGFIPFTGEGRSSCSK